MKFLEFKFERFVFGKQSRLQHWILLESELLPNILKGFNV